MWTNKQLSTDLLIFTKKIFNDRIDFLCRELHFYLFFISN